MQIQKHAYNFPLTNQLFEAHWIHCRNSLVTSDLFNSYFSIQFYTIWQFFLQHSVNNAYSTLSILHLRKGSVVTGLGDIMFKFRFSSYFAKHFENFFEGYHYLIIGYSPLITKYGLFKLTILISIICDQSILPFKIVLIKVPFVR